MKDLDPTNWTPATSTGDRFQAFDAFRDSGEIRYNPLLGWMVFGYQQIVEIARDHSRFSNVRVNKGDDCPVQMPNIPLELDPPDHTRYRNMLKDLFAPAEIVTFEDRIRAIVRKDLQPLLQGDPMPFVEHFADPVPVRVLCDFLGWQVDDWRMIKRMSEANRVAMTERSSAKLDAAQQAWADYILPVVAERRKTPQNDVTSWLLARDFEGRALEEREIINILRALLVGGHGTTSASVGLIVAYLASNPVDQAQLRENPARISYAIEEILRCFNPLAQMQRTATCDMEFHGAQIRKGDRVAMFFAGGNRDPEVFGCPHQVDLDRKPKRNLVFGSGIHTCIGSPLARIELRTIISELLAATESLSIIGPAPMVRATSWPTNELDDFLLKIVPKR